MLKIFKKYLETSFLLKMTIGFILGISVGIIVGPSAEILAPLGTLFMRLLQMIIVPLILFTLIVATNNTNPLGLGRVGGKIFVYYMFTTFVAVAIGIAFSILFDPGKNVDIGVVNVDEAEIPSFIETLLGIVPSNIMEAIVDTNVLAMVFVALIFGFVISSMRFSGDTRLKHLGDLLFDFADAGNELVMKVLKGILQYAPIGVFGIGASVFANQSLDVLGSLIRLTGVTYGAYILHFLAIYVVILLIFRVPVLKFIKDIKDCLAVAFITSSSLGTLPITLASAKKAGINNEVASFTLPLGATVNMDGGAIRLGVAAIFAATIAGVDLSLLDMILIVITATLASVGMAGVPGSGLLTLTIVLTQAGLPLEVVAIIAGVDAIVQMGSTLLNILGDLVGAKIVDESEKKHRGVAEKEPIQGTGS